MYTPDMTHEKDWVYVTIWEFHPRPGQEKAFEQAYGPDGEWVQFFKKGEGYLRTELIRDLSNPRRFLTLDYWQSRAACDSFRAQNVSEYEAIDKRYEGLNEKELALGAFERVAG